MKKCKNCGHDLTGCGVNPHKHIIELRKLSLFCCGVLVSDGVLCGCTNPEPEGV